jgi:hypothetical protein
VACSVAGDSYGGDKGQGQQGVGDQTEAGSHRIVALRPVGRRAQHRLHCVLSHRRPAARERRLTGHGPGVDVNGRRRPGS